MQRKNDTLELKVYTNEEFQKKIERDQAWAMVLYGVAAGLNASMAGYTTSYSTTYSSGGSIYTTATQHYNPNAVSQANLATTNQILTLGQVMENDRVIREQGYLKKTMIYPNEAIVGYMNIKRKKGSVLTINVPVNNHIYSFDWNVNKKK